MDYFLEKLSKNQSQTSFGLQHRSQGKEKVKFKIIIQAGKVEGDGHYFARTLPEPGL
jgi:hypothetical protein